MDSALEAGLQHLKAGSNPDRDSGDMGQWSLGFSAGLTEVSGNPARVSSGKN